MKPQISRELEAELRELFTRLAEVRFRPIVLYPRLCWHFIRNHRRDKKALQKGIGKIIAAASSSASIAPDTLSTYLERVILLHYLQQCGIKVYSMINPLLMKSLAGECARVIAGEIPGDFVDVGVWKGGSSMIIKAVADRLRAGRALFCLDVFDTMDGKVLGGGDPAGDHAIIAALDFSRDYFGTEGVSTSVAEVRQNFQSLGVSLDDVNFLKGNLVDPAFPFERIERIALLRIDCDFYTATRRTLGRLYPKVSPGGTIIFDDYYLEAFGERRAADEFRAALGITTPLQQVAHSAVWIKDTA